MERDGEGEGSEEEQQRLKTQCAHGIASSLDRLQSVMRGFMESLAKDPQKTLRDLERMQDAPPGSQTTFLFYGLLGALVKVPGMEGLFRDGRFQFAYVPPAHHPHILLTPPPMTE